MDVAITKSTVEKATTDDVDQILNPPKVPTDDTTELLILIDSNSNFLDRRKFWRLDKTKWERCGTVYEAGKAIQRTTYKNLCACVSGSQRRGRHMRGGGSKETH